MAKKKKRKQKIRIFFKDGCKDIIPQKLWDDYDYISKENITSFIVKRREQWIAIYNIDDVSCIVIG